MAESHTETQLPPWIPYEVSEALREARDRNFTGHLEIHYKNGSANHLAERRTSPIPKNCPNGQNQVPCPACGKPMEPYDYGNGYRCVCGVKRTRSQIIREARGDG